MPAPAVEAKPEPVVAAAEPAPKPVEAPRAVEPAPAPAVEPKAEPAVDTAKDPLNSLPNRDAFGDDVRRRVEQNHKYQSPVTVLYCGVDKFPSITEKFGREAGNVVLRAVAQFLKAVLRDQEMLARIAPAEKRAYEEAMATLRGGDFDKASAAYAGFQRRFPGSGYEPSVRFWQANALYGKRDYKEAVAAFRAFVTASPQHPRAPEAMLALANSQAEMKDVRGARKTIDDLMKAYPTSEAAQAGKDRLATLR